VLAGDLARRRLERVASTDSLTGLPNRRALKRALTTACRAATAEHPIGLILLDLDGFKSYNDTFGHPAGDALLIRMGERLQAAARDFGRAYRLGGDEFCLLVQGDALPAAIAAAEGALVEHGEGFRVTASSGSVLMPSEAPGESMAMRLADERLYVRKANGRASAGRQLTDVLLRIQDERDPATGRHVEDVASLAERVGAALGMSDAELRTLARGAALHDIGKVAIPDSIMVKAGPLDEAEWTFMRRHTIIGERMLAEAPALAHVAPLVRSSHEAWDGSGYPDGLAGDDIPLGARIIAVCDAYEAMISDRPYRRGVSPMQAIAELRRCAGRQFDPRVVTAFARAVTTSPLVETVR
jgi:diguanylate cyclase (GGDEF)-like protein